MSLNSNTELALINTTTNSGTITLPLIANNDGRVLTFKDIQGTFRTNTLTLQCSGSDTFEDNSTIKILSESYGSIQLVGSGTKWYILNGIQVNTIQVSTLNTITISSFNICTINSQISSLTFIDSFQSTTNMYATISSVSTQAVSTNFLYYNDFVIAGTRIGYSNNFRNRNFSLLQIPGLSLWLDASDRSTIALSTNTSSITTWFDKSGNNNHARGSNTSVLITNNPRYVFSGLNSSNIIRTGASNTGDAGYFTIPFANNLNIGANNFSIFTVYKTNTSTNIFYPFLSINFCNANQVEGCFTLANLNGRNVGLLGRSFGSAINRASPINAVAVDTWTLATINRNITSVVIVTINGTEYNTGGIAAGINFIPSVLNPNIIITGDAGGFYLRSDIAELLFYNSSIALTQYQRQQVEGYLAWKWGLQANLPATHPFRNAPP